MINESYKKSAANYNKAAKLYDNINNAWHEISSGGVRNVDYKINNTLRKLREFDKVLSGIDIDDIKEKVSGEKLDKVKENIELFREASYYIERDLKSIDYADDLKDVIDNYFEQLHLKDAELRKWGGREKAIKLFIAAITHPDRVLDYENEIRRIIKGKMSTNEFKRIFSVLQEKMSLSSAHKKSRKERPEWSELPPEMWPKDVREKHYKSKRERWAGVKKDKEEKAEEHGISTQPPEDEFVKNKQSYLITPSGETKKYSFDVKGKDGIVRYMDDEGDVVYSYVYEGFMGFSTFEKLITS